MATIIDSLVVELGLDTNNFSPKAKTAVDDLKRLEDANTKRSKTIAEGTKRESEAIRGLTNTALGFFAVLTGASGLKDFVVNTLQAGANVGRLSRAIGVSANEISKWQGVAREFGSTGENMAGAFKSLSDVFTAWQVGGPEAPGIMQMFRVINTEAERLDKNNAKTIDGTKGVNAALIATADNLKIIHDLADDKNKNLASYLAGKIPGMDAGLFDALIRGGDQMTEMLKKVAGWTDAEAEAAGRVQRRWDAAKVSAENYGKTAIFKAADAASPLAHELFDKPLSEAKPWDALFGWGDYAPGKAVPSLTQPSVNSTSVSGGFTSPGQKEAFIRAEAAKRGISPDVAMMVARSEGFNQFSGDGGTSGGAFQLHVTPGGRGHAVGDEFRSKTGLDPLNPANEARSIQFALDDAKAHGWSAYHGAARSGLGAWAGIDRNGGGGGTTNTVEINGPVTVTGVRDPVDFTNKLRDLGLKRQADANQSAVGGQ
jgi:transposase-like protein